MVRTRTDSFSGNVWIIADPDDHQPIFGTPYPDFVTKLLRRRGVHTSAEAMDYLFDSPPPDSSHLQLPDAEIALARIEKANRDGEAIAVYGDFDVDGVTATAILTEAILAIGGHVTPFIPNRFTDGYGLRKETLQKLQQDHGTSLVITADCGISANHEIAYANSLGQDVVIIDHHSPPNHLPPAHATVNPKVNPEGSSFRDFSTGALAYKIGQALIERSDQKSDPLRWLDLATLSTVADLVPIRGENRWLVRDGLEAIRNTTRPGLRALLNIAGLWGTNLDTDSIAYGIGPRINAAGRLDSASRALELLMETDPQKAEQLAIDLDKLNIQRRRMTVDAIQNVRNKLALEKTDLPITFIGGNDLPSGIIGIVASQIAEERNRPAFIFERGEKISRASCRSIPGFDVAAALRKCDDILEKHGGHAMAAGFTIRTSNLSELKNRLSAQAELQLAGIDHRPRIEIDAQTRLSQIKTNHINWLQRLAPFGEGNPPVTFMSRRVLISNAKRVGVDNAHLRLTLNSGRHKWPGIAFNLGKAPCDVGDYVDIVWSIKANKTSGATELEIKDLGPSSVD